jgi:predicted nucleic acid-binding protein
VERVLAGLVIRDFDAAAARWYALTKAALLDQGRPAGDCDTMIAALALASRERVVTQNTAHFAGRPGLVVSSY